jgi:hypothetical protein
MVMKMKLATLLVLLIIFAMPVVADDVDKWIQDLTDPVHLSKKRLDAGQYD